MTFSIDRMIVWRIAVFAALVATSIFLSRSANDIALIWLPNAVAIFMCVDEPRKRYPFYALAFWATNMFINVGVGDTFLFSGIIAAANQIEIWTVIFLLNLWTARDAPISFENRVFRTYAILTIGPIASSMVGVPLITSYFGDPPVHAFVHWFIADFISLVIIGGFLIYRRSFAQRARTSNPVNIVEVFCVLLGMGMLVFLQYQLSAQFFLAGILPIMWAALRLPDQRGAATIAVIAVLTTLILPQSNDHQTLPEMVDAVLYSQIILGIFSLAGNIVHQLNCFTRQAMADLEAANRDLTESRLFSKLAEDASQLGHWHYDVASRTVRWNDNVHHMHGTDPETFVPSVEKVSELIFEDDRELVVDQFMRAIHAKQPVEYVYRIRRENGAVRTLQVISTVINGADNAPQQMLGVVQDLTDRKREEELQRAYTELERFSYACSHDLSEPTRLLSVLTDILISDMGAEADPERRDILESINRNARRLNDLVANLLTYSRDGNAVDTTPVNLDLVRQQVEEALGLMIREKKARVVSDQLGGATGSIIQYRQLFQNLLSNSLRHSRFSQPPRIFIRRVNDPGALHLVFTDNGDMLEAQTIVRINDALQSQGVETARRKGLGLWITASIIRRKGGRIWCEPGTEGQAQFHIVMPLVQPDAVNLTKVA